jgi:glycosyltransferase involved in cell wall biosynthesis
VRVAVVTARRASAAFGDSDTSPTALLDALRAAGHHATEVAVPADHSTLTATLESYARCYALDLAQYDLAISTGAPTFMASHPNHTSYLTHVLANAYASPGSDPPPAGARWAQQRTVQALDRFGLRPGRVRRHFSRGHTIYRRLRDSSSWWTTVGYRALPHPPALSGFVNPRAQNHILVADRPHEQSRLELIVDAYRHVPGTVPLLVVGAGGDDERLRALAGEDGRVKFLGEIPDADLLDLYADALLVVSVRREAEHALATLEAFKSGKPVLTCTDSGEPLSFVRHGETGYVAEPTAQGIAGCLTAALGAPSSAAAMGARAARAVSGIAWEPIVDALTGRARHSPLRRVRAAEPQPQGFRLTVLDAEYGHAPQDNGRSRLVGLFHALGPDLPVTCVGLGGSDSFPTGTGSLERVDVPLHESHESVLAGWRRKAGGQVIAATLPHHAHHSPAYVQEVRQQVAAADIVVFSRPWVYPLVKDLLDRRRQLIVYAAHDVEGLTTTRELGHDAFGARIAAHATVLERELCHAADLIVVPSHYERTLFHDLYNLPFSSCRVVPNGTFTTGTVPADAERRATAKRTLGLPPGPLALFVGGSSVQDLDAVQFLNGTVAPTLPVVTFVLNGDAAAGLAMKCIAPNVHLTGALSDEQLRLYIDAADVALNPLTGSAPRPTRTMFDFMAAGVPIVTTAAGAGCVAAGDLALTLASREDFAALVAHVLRDESRAAALGNAGRRVACERHSWERLSPALGRVLHRYRRSLGKPRPIVSVIVTTRDRSDAIDTLMECLARQTLRHFEVIVVDRGVRSWTAEPALRLELLHVHVDEQGVGQARNIGASLARAGVLAFVDDHGRPDADWLENAVQYFEQPDAVGVEGLIVSDRLHDERFHAFSNIGREGLAFSAANLFLRRELFEALDGFDLRFDHPFTFREDTDLAWRALEHGAIPFGDNVRVYHPPQVRAETVEFQAHEQRLANNALLRERHPERSRELFLNDARSGQTPGRPDHDSSSSPGVRRGEIDTLAHIASRRRRT